MSCVPKKQPNHRYLEALEPDFFDWLDIHYGDHSFEGVVSVGYKRTTGLWPLKSCRITELKSYLKEMHISQQLDYYLTANTVIAGKRQNEFLFSLNNIVIDIDCHGENLTPKKVSALVEAVIWRAKRDYWNETTFPQPNSIVRTGRGVQFWWAIKPCAAATIRYYTQIRSVFLHFLSEMVSKHEELKDLMLDASPSNNNVGYFRLPGTYNTNAKKYSSLEILHKEPYNTQALYELVKPNLPKRSSKRENNAPVSEVHTEKEAVALDANDLDLIRKCNYQCSRRIAKFIQLRNIRNRNIGAESRDLLCLIVYCELRKVYDHDNAMIYLRQFNDGFKEPFDEDILLKKLSSAKDTCYLYSNQRIIEVLEITPAEQNQINFHPASPHGGTQRRPNASRDEVRRIKREGRDAKIIELYKAGLSRTEIGRELGINRKTAAAVITKWENSQRTTQKEGDQKWFLNCTALYKPLQEEEILKQTDTHEDLTYVHQNTITDNPMGPVHSGYVVLAPACSSWNGVDLTKPIACKEGLYVYKRGDFSDSS